MRPRNADWGARPVHSLQCDIDTRKSETDWSWAHNLTPSVVTQPSQSSTPPPNVAPPPPSFLQPDVPSSNLDASVGIDPP